MLWHLLSFDFMELSHEVTPDLSVFGDVPVGIKNM